MKAKFIFLSVAVLGTFWSMIVTSAVFPSGTYNSTYNRVFFTCSSYEQCTGTYTGTGDGNPAKIIGKFSQSGQMVGYWLESASSKKCSSRKEGTYYWGRVDFRFSPDANSWKGFYSYCNDSPSTRNKWDGWR